MGRVGSCYDNAVAESFFATLKAEIGTRVWATRAEARRVVFAYLTYYNRNRLHSTLKHRTRTKPASATVNPSPYRHETPVSGPGWNFMTPHSCVLRPLVLSWIVYAIHRPRGTARCDAWQVAST